MSKKCGMAYPHCKVRLRRKQRKRPPWSSRLRWWVCQSGRLHSLLDLWIPYLPGRDRRRSSTGCLVECSPRGRARSQLVRWMFLPEGKLATMQHEYAVAEAELKGTDLILDSRCCLLCRCIPRRKRTSLAHCHTCLQCRKECRRQRPETHPSNVESRRKLSSTSHCYMCIQCHSCRLRMLQLLGYHRRRLKNPIPVNTNQCCFDNSRSGFPHDLFNLLCFIVHSLFIYLSLFLLSVFLALSLLSLLIYFSL